MEEVKEIKAKQEELWNNTNRFHAQIIKEQEMLAREIQEVQKGEGLCSMEPLSHHGASSSSQLDQQEPVPLRIAPPIPGYQPPRPPPN
ncbi:hypothetical protein PIB30_097388 [Stylosanthes scabra]|uniref:Uncharacterized protein n=1 Tax=Stylosanthes scabra TaxID=79078 RepID=A0ABU6RWT7_9FABA|nr:hypothetical protein [Stylosanthes scabra]